LCRSFGTTVERTCSGLIWFRIRPSGVLENVVMNFRIPENANNLLTDEEILASEEELRLMKLVVSLVI
jgi:hypothetical protein